MYDYGIIGGGPAGYTAGMLLAKQGNSVILFEKDKLGGTCLNRGCIPTKAFLHYSEEYASLKKIAEFTSIESLPQLDFSKVVEKKNATVEKIRKSLELAVKNSGVETVYAEACIKDKHTIEANNKEYQINKIIIATGSKPKEVKGLEFDGKFILNSDDILALEKLPKSILIIGSGAIGIEWARILSNFNVEVSIVEMAEHLIPLADTEVSKRIERIFKQRKIKFYLNDLVEKTENKKVTLKSGIELEPELILVATGRSPVCMPCDDASILGDACGEVQLAHYAISQAKFEAMGIPYDKTLIPSIIYGEPEIAWVGVREQDMDDNSEKYMLPITALGKSWCDEATDGFIKLIVKNGKITGAHIVSKEASSLIHTVLYAIQNQLNIKELQKISYAHPTYAEGIGEILNIF